jgi:hypothetical protein
LAFERIWLPYIEDVRRCGNWYFVRSIVQVQPGGDSDAHPSRSQRCVSMSAAKLLPIVDGASPDALKPVLFDLDTTSGSVLHRVLRQARFRPTTTRIYLLALAAAWIPLAIGAVLTPTATLAISAQHPLRLHNDWNALFMFALSFPCMLIFCLTDQRALSNALRIVQLDGTVTFSDQAAKSLGAAWERRFKYVNIGGQIAGLAVGLVIAVVNFRIYTTETIGYWIADHGRILPIGIAFLCCLMFFYAVITLYVFRNIAVAYLFDDIVAHTQLRLLPMHPDKSGGLHPVGQLGLRNQYVLMLLGVNLVLLVTVTVLYLQPPRSLYELIAAAIIFYIVFGPLVFVAPLLPFRAGMLRTKSELMAEVAQRLRVELQRIRGQLHSSPILKEDEELIDRLRKIVAVIDELPVWPFDASTLRKFLAAYVLPVLTTAGLPLARVAFEFAKTHLP